MLENCNHLMSLSALYVKLIGQLKRLRFVLSKNSWEWGNCSFFLNGKSRGGCPSHKIFA